LEQYYKIQSIKKGMHLPVIRAVAVSICNLTLICMRFHMLTFQGPVQLMYPTPSCIILSYQ